jgi:hypothetical protein
MKLPGVVGDDGVGEQCERAGDHDALIATAAAIVPNGTGVDDALQLLHGLTAYQEPIGTAPELGLHRLVGQVHSGPQLAELAAGAMETQAADP